MFAFDTVSSLRENFIPNGIFLTSMYWEIKSLAFELSVKIYKFKDYNKGNPVQILFLILVVIKIVSA